MATRVEASQEGLSESTSQVHVSTTKEASVASEADMLAPMCQTFCDLIMVMWNANAVNEVKYENLVERWVRRPKEKGMYEIQRNARRLILHEDMFDRWSRGHTFAKEMCFPKGGTCCEFRSECGTERSSMCCCNEDRQTEAREERCDECIQRFEERLTRWRRLD